MTPAPQDLLVPLVDQEILGRLSSPIPAGKRGDLVHRLCSVDVSEVFSPPRVGKEATKFGLVGDAMDLTTGWDFKPRST